MSVVSKVVTLL